MFSETSLIFGNRHEYEIQECRQQLKQALAEEKEIADEIERAKRVLQLERGAAARREKELEEMRAAHAREVNKLARSRAALDHLPRAATALRPHREENRLTRKLSDQVAALTDACRRAEQARRESVSRLAPVQSKESDMTEELARMKEKDWSPLASPLPLP